MLGTLLRCVRVRQGGPPLVLGEGVCAVARERDRFLEKSTPRRSQIRAKAFAADHWAAQHSQAAISGTPKGR